MARGETEGVEVGGNLKSETTDSKSTEAAILAQPQIATTDKARGLTSFNEKS